MKNYVIFLFVVASIMSCQEIATVTGSKVSNVDELYEALAQAEPGDQIVMANGVYRDVTLNFAGNGEEGKMISLKAETPGEVFIEGKSYLKFAGSYLSVDGLYFRNGYTPSNAVITFRINKDSLAHHCTVSNTVIEDFNQPLRDTKDHWVEFWGTHNTMENCYLAGKSNEGPTVRVDIKGRESINNYHQIVHNHFGPRPRKGGPRGETIQIGDSYTSMSPCYTNVSHNLFERCNGEVEVISSKTNFNEFRNNVFYKSEGSLVTRHGNYCTIDGNYFIGDGNENVGGVRLINTGHIVTNNYFYNLKGKEFRSPLAVMNGIPKSPLNRYNQVTDVVVAYNSWINCEAPLHFGVGTNISQAEVLPPSEIRSARPIRTTLANNLIYSEKGDPTPIVAHDKIDGIKFKENLINNQNVSFDKVEGVIPASFSLKKITDEIYIPEGLPDSTPYTGFGFDKIEKDLFGNDRKDNNSIGATIGTTASDPGILDKSKYGPDWFSDEKPEVKPTTHAATNGKELMEKITAAKAGDIVELVAGNYSVAIPLVIDKPIFIRSKSGDNKANINYTGAVDTPLFELHPRGELTIKGLKLSGGNQQYLFSNLKKDMSSLYNLSVMDSEISGFKYVLKAYKQTMADDIIFKNTMIKNCANGIELSEETNDRGDYNVEFLTIDNCQFENVKANVIDYYRGGYDESTIGGNLKVTNSSFKNCGAKESNGILLNTRGIINVDISNNTFTNNPVKLIALLWGAKNNTHSDNKISNSGKIVVQENIKLKLMY